MKINFRTINGTDDVTKDWLEQRAAYLMSTNWVAAGTFRRQESRPEGFEKFYCVDVLGAELTWMNATFDRDRFKWYLWFESVFLVPEEMVPFLRLRWQ